MAGKSTLNRLELSKASPSRYHKIAHDAAAIEALFVELFLDSHIVAPDEIMLDLDATDDPLYGHQEGRFFHGGGGGGQRRRFKLRVFPARAQRPMLGHEFVEPVDRPEIDEARYLADVRAFSGALCLARPMHEELFRHGRRSKIENAARGTSRSGARDAAAAATSGGKK